MNIQGQTSTTPRKIFISFILFDRLFDYSFIKLEPLIFISLIERPKLSRRRRNAKKKQQNKTKRKEKKRKEKKTTTKKQTNKKKQKKTKLSSV